VELTGSGNRVGVPERAEDVDLLALAAEEAAPFERMSTGGRSSFTEIPGSCGG
jgi:hypothetical protein